VVGRVTALDPATKEITIATRTFEGEKPVIINVTEKTVMRRYAPDSVKFADAVPSTFADLKIGDQLRALGEKSADGAHFASEEVVSGSFRMVGGTITSINPAINEIKINDLQTKQPLTIVINQDSVMRRLPPTLAQMFGQGGGVSGGGMGRARRGEGSPQANQQQNQTGAPERAREGAGVASSSGSGGAGMMRRSNGGEMGARAGVGGRDFQEIFDSFPPVTLAELKPGDMIIVNSTVGNDPTRLVAIRLASGVEPLLSRLQQRSGRPIANAAGAINADNIGFPSGVLDSGIGLP
jgi:hypothetical protein